MDSRSIAPEKMVAPAAGEVCEFTHLIYRDGAVSDKARRIEAT